MPPAAPLEGCPRFARLSVVEGYSAPFWQGHTRMPDGYQQTTKLSLDRISKRDRERERESYTINTLVNQFRLLRLLIHELAFILLPNIYRISWHNLHSTLCSGLLGSNPSSTAHLLHSFSLICKYMTHGFPHILPHKTGFSPQHSQENAKLHHNLPQFFSNKSFSHGL